MLVLDLCVGVDQERMCVGIVRRGNDRGIGSIGRIAMERVWICVRFQ